MEIVSGHSGQPNEFPNEFRVTKIAQQIKRPDRYSIYVNDKFAFGLGEGALLESGLATGRVLSATEFSSLKKDAGLDKAYGNTLRFVALRPRSEWEVRQYLRRRQIDDEPAQAIFVKLQTVGLVDDLAFARSWVASRRLLKSTSKRRLSLELKQKRIAEPIIQQVLKEDETDERQSLKDLIAKKRARYPDDQKLMQYLARQGFSYDDIRSALRVDDV